MPIRIELRISPYLMRSASLVPELEAMAGTKNLVFKERRSETRCAQEILCYSPEDASRCGVALIEDKDVRNTYGDSSPNSSHYSELLFEAMKFAAWQLIHNEDTEEDSEDGKQ